MVEAFEVASPNKKQDGDRVLLDHFPHVGERWVVVALGKGVVTADSVQVALAIVWGQGTNQLAI